MNWALMYDNSLNLQKLTGKNTSNLTRMKCKSNLSKHPMIHQTFQKNKMILQTFQNIK